MNGKKDRERWGVLKLPYDCECSSCVEGKGKKQLFTFSPRDGWRAQNGVRYGEGLINFCSVSILLCGQ